MTPAALKSPQTGEGARADTRVVVCGKDGGVSSELQHLWGDGNGGLVGGEHRLVVGFDHDGKRRSNAPNKKQPESNEREPLLRFFKRFLGVAAVVLVLSFFSFFPLSFRGSGTHTHAPINTTHAEGQTSIQSVCNIQAFASRNT